MIEAYRKAGFTDFSIHTPWKTNIDPYSKLSKGIDHLFVIGEEDSRDLRSDEVLDKGNLQETIDILNSTNTCPCARDNNVSGQAEKDSIASTEHTGSRENICRVSETRDEDYYRKRAQIVCLGGDD